MTQTTDTRDLDLILRWVRREANSRDNDWPGMPVSGLPFSMAPTVDAAIADGTLKIVTRPAKVDPSQTRSYICEA